MQEKKEEEEEGREGGRPASHHEQLRLERESVQLGKSKVFLRKVRREGGKEREMANRVLETGFLFSLSSLFDVI